MAIFRCEQCDYLREVPAEHLGKRAKCPSCGDSSPVRDTLMALATMLDDLKNTRAQNQQLQQQVSQLSEEKQRLAEDNQRLQSRPAPPAQATEGYAFANLDSAPELENTSGVVRWFKQRQIQVEVDKKAIDISGFFDEVAVLLGDNLDSLKPVLDKMNWCWRKGYDKATVELPEDPVQAQTVRKFCESLYEYAFVAKCIHGKDRKLILVLQKERNIVNFFTGDWLEWYAFMKTASLLLEKRIEFSSLRSFGLQFADHEKRELDLFFLLENKQPLWIECKSGEFRDSIEKYSRLRKSLGISKEYAILLVTNLSEEKAKGLTSMFDITVVTEKTLLGHISALLSA